MLGVEGARPKAEVGRGAESGSGGHEEQQGRRVLVGMSMEPDEWTRQGEGKAEKGGE